MIDYEKVLGKILDMMAELGYTVPQSPESRAMFASLIADYQPSRDVVSNAFRTFMSRPAFGLKVTPSAILPILNELLVGPADEAWNELEALADSFTPGQQLDVQYKHPATEAAKRESGIQIFDLRQAQGAQKHVLRQRFVEAFTRITTANREIRDKVIEHRRDIVAAQIAGPKEAKQLSG